MSRIHYITRGSGQKLLLIHGLGGNCHSFDNIMDELSAKRQVIAIDLPGFGETPASKGEVSISSLADAVTEFLVINGWTGIDAVGSSMGARLVLELARRNIIGHAIALDPGGFWRGWERHAFYSSLFASYKLIRAIRPALPKLLRSEVGRVALLSQLSAHPTKLDPDFILLELNSYLSSQSFAPLLKELAYGEEQGGIPKKGFAKKIVIGWGEKDRVTLPIQAERVKEKFPDAKIQWFSESGHYPHWDRPKDVIKLILRTTQMSNSLKPSKVRVMMSETSPSMLAH